MVAVVVRKDLCIHQRGRMIVACMCSSLVTEMFPSRNVEAVSPKTCMRQHTKGKVTSSQGNQQQVQSLIVPRGNGGVRDCQEGNHRVDRNTVVVVVHVLRVQLEIDLHFEGHLLSPLRSCFSQRL